MEKKTRGILKKLWKLEQRNIDDLLPNKKNPRRISKHEAEMLEQSINRFGMCEPIVINLDGSIIGGHQRIKILKKLGFREVDVHVSLQQLNSEDADALSILLNKAQGKFDHDILANEWDLDFLLENGFTMEELQLESIPSLEEPEEENKKPQSCSMNIKFLDVDHLQEAENAIATIVESYKGATYKVRIK